MVLAIPFLAAGAVFASSAGIDSTSRYAWTENAGWLDFGTSQGNVAVGDAALTGYVWGENLGWISLNCANTDSCAAVDYKAANDGAGNLSGYAWGENAGWIVFNCATTDSCAGVDYKVKTAWRQASSQTGGTSGGSIGGQYAWPQADAQSARQTGASTGIIDKIIQIAQVPFFGVTNKKPAAGPSEEAPPPAAPENPPENIEPPPAETEEIAMPVSATPPAGAGAHQNIELKPQFDWRQLFGGKMILLAVAIMLAVIFWRGRKRNREI